jgi:hypothetical protein
MVAVAQNHVQTGQVGGVALDDSEAATEGGPHDFGINRVDPRPRS